MNSTAHLLKGNPPTWKRLHMPENAFNKWVSIRDNWREVYPLCTSVNTRTLTVIDRKNGIKTQFRKFASRWLDLLYFQEETTSTDRLIFRVKLHKKGITRRGKIKAAPQPHLIPMPNGKFHVMVSNLSERTRTRLHPLANYILVCWNIGDNNPGKPENYKSRMISTKARFILDAGMKNSGKRLWLMARYVNASNDEMSSPWCTPRTVMVPW
jgi:hypothetical protein